MIFNKINELFTNFHFIRSEWLYCYVIIIVLLFFTSILKKNKNSWANIIDKKLYKKLTQKNKITKKSLLSTNSIIFTFLVLIILALAGPSFYKQDVKIYQNQTPWIIALDLSDDMLKKDIAPSRLKRAKFKIKDFLNKNSDNSFALITFTKNAYDIIPLTNDFKTINHILSSLEPEIMPEFGHNISSVVKHSNKIMKDNNLDAANLLIITSKGATASDFTDIKNLKNDKLNLSILSINKNEQISLKDLAKINNGIYSNITNNDSDINYISNNSKNLSDYKLKNKDIITIWQDSGIYITLLLIPIGFMLLKRNMLNVIAFTCLYNILTLSNFINPSNNLYANSDKNLEYSPSLTDKILYNNNQIAKKYLDNKNFKGAVNLFEHDNWKAFAYIKDKNYKEADKILSKHQDATSLYNYGNSLALQHKFQDAINAYSKALEKQPNFSDARVNKKIIENILDKQKQQDQKDQKNQKGQKDQKDQKDQKNQKDQKDHTKEQEKKSNLDKQEQQQKALEKSIEQRKKTNATLRQLPDNPEIFLKNKLRYEHWKRQHEN
tara:strand:+ start:19615 stop:21267 length:1653 start_codon:yes stop_codon:yes gene_type:complete